LVQIHLCLQCHWSSHQQISIQWQ